MSATKGRVYHVTNAVTGGTPYADCDGVDRWDFTAACAIAVVHHHHHPGEPWYVKEVADRRVRWLGMMRP